MKLKICFAKGTYSADNLIKLLEKKGVKPHATNSCTKQLRLDDYSKEKRVTIKQAIETHINTLKPGTCLRADILWWELFRYKIARNSVTRGLGQLAKEGKVKKSDWSSGRNSEWEVL